MTPEKRGRGAEGKSLIAAAVEVNERETDRVRLERIPDASGSSLKSFIERNIEPSSTIITDGWPSYSELEKKGYIHEVQRSIVKEDNEETLLFSLIFLNLLLFLFAAPNTLSLFLKTVINQIQKNG